MHIFIYGEVNEVGSGAWCYAETLREMGHMVTAFSPHAYLDSYQQPSLRRFYRKVMGHILETDRKIHSDALISEVYKLEPDILLILKGLYISKMDVLEIKKNSVWVANINHDDFFSHNINNWSHIQRNAIPAYDFIFTTREVNIEELKPHNRNVKLFPFAYYPRIHRPVPIPESEQSKWCVDVVFVGTWEKKRSLMLETLVQRVPARYAIYGSQWDKVNRRSPLRPYISDCEVKLDDMAKAIGGAKIALGFLRAENRDDYTQRTFEIPACGGLLLAERTKRHSSFYQEGTEAEFFDPNSSEELCEKVGYLLTHDIEREQIRQAGNQALQRQHHTYKDRLEELIHIFNNSKPKSGSI